MTHKEFQIHISDKGWLPIQIHFPLELNAQWWRRGRPLRRFGAGIGFYVREQTLFLPRSNSFPSSPSFSLCVSLPGDQCQLHVATAARLVLLSLDVVVYLELGLILLLGGSVLQLPDEERRRKLDAEEVDVWDGAHGVSTSRK